MDETPAPLPRNLQTQAKHRRETLLQVWLPLIVGGAVLLGVIAAIIAAAASGSGEVRRWQAVSLIVLLCPQLLVSLLCLGAMGGMVFGVIKLADGLPGFAYKVQKFFELLRDKTQQFADQVARPVIKAGGISAAARVFLRRKNRGAKE